MGLANLDIAVFIVYVVGLIGLASWVSREKEGHTKNTEDYFLASKSLPWWAIGASLIAANISAEQIIGMSGSGYALGLGIASYEWMGGLGLIIVAKYMLPIFLKQKIYTMPQYLEQRYNHSVRMIMATFWLALYVFVNLTSILWLGALAINTITGISMTYGMIFLGVFALSYSLYGGLKAVAFTDIIQVVLLIFGGLFLSYLTLDMISNGQGFWQGAQILTDQFPEKFDMILSEDNPYYKDLPGISVLIGGMWVMNFSYWGFNQYIIQRALAAKSIQEAQKGMNFAAFLKLLMPIIVVLPGIAAVTLAPDLERPDQAYPTMMNLMPVGLKGLIFAALVAAVVSSLASMINSISTIFTMDMYSHYKPDRSQSHYVMIGRMVSISALIIAMIVAQPLLSSFDQGFKFIQDFTGFFTPGIVVIFVLGLFWKRATANGAIVAALGSFLLSCAFYYLLPDYPFMDRVGVVFVICLVLAIVISLMGKPVDHPQAVDVRDMDFSTSKSFNIQALIFFLILVAFYATWW
ncbi:MAG: sodium/solute symporter [Kordiimonadaceae bacterium]|jgi:solute:Na+ symporter, SSS family|nr:sodium/solute symporter [Kordiimonadaceae bacterium]MBT6037346.1 sodium/solute symporter [Kordiimonadaceae bacterium]MBT6330490.1 sodium/solute symporter [Kordiimonadaceae bacterium]MBT7582321.1 sodium/solute symporter [Kordiimonadaceae bacterium]